MSIEANVCKTVTWSHFECLLELWTKDTQTVVDARVKISIVPTEFEACLRYMNVNPTSDI